MTNTNTITNAEIKTRLKIQIQIQTHLGHEDKEKRDANKRIENAEEPTSGCCWGNVAVTNLEYNVRLQYEKIKQVRKENSVTAVL